MTKKTDKPEVTLGPGLITEEVDLPIGLAWGDKMFTKALLRAERMDDEAEAIDLLMSQGRMPGWDVIQDDAEMHYPVGLIATTKRLLRIKEVKTADGKEVLNGAELRIAVFQNGLHPADGAALVEADQRLGKRLPAVSGPSETGDSSSSSSSVEASGSGKSNK